ncbi:hypothetical protein [Hymenobacter sediminicola]|uniref:Glycosyltransferase family 39 protein n=1 Tax=Hymenobacter sediminicola TaxID=2761579 RepID=A0A7G7WA48_9BACT|nr:hypothetical protein [Hymenobacter sediminicola]QNH63241.1 hypothetical protein H4317_05390 [Hymenobacter sediminicola]
MQLVSRFSAFWLPLLALATLVVVRLHGLTLAALPDYDSVRNWEIVREVATGNLQNLFHHGSPGFSLVYAPVAWFTADYRVFQHLNALVAVAALAWLVQFVAREVRLAAWEAALLLLFAGTSVFLTFSGRDFTAGSWSLLLFVGLLRAHYQRLQQPSPTTIVQAAVWLALGLSINYKFLLTLPILLLLELLYGGRLLWQPRTLWRVVAVLLAPYAVLGLLGMAGGVPWYRWEAVYYNLVFPGASNAAGRAGHLRFDGLYYLRFLWDFESPVVLPVLAVGVAWLGWRYGRRWELLRLTLAWYLAVWASCFLLGMSLLLKAPRGLLLAYPLFYMLAFLLLRWALRSRFGLAGTMILGTVAALATGFNLYRVQQEIYAYLPTHYGKVATWLHQQQRGRVRIASTVSLGLRPFLQDTDTVAVAMSDVQLQELRQKGYRFVLLDAAWRVAGAAPFTSLAHYTPLATWSEPLLTSPLLFLEHSEYTGLGYSATLARQRAARLDSVQLRLYRLP